MKKLCLILFLLVGIQSHVFGFATIYHSIKGGDKITFTSNTNGVQVFLENKKVGVINGVFTYTIQKRDGENKVFTFKKNGYKTETASIQTEFEPVFWGNILIGVGSIASSVDSLTTQNYRKYSPNQIFIELEKN